MLDQAAGRRGHARGLKRRIPGSHVRLRFAGDLALDAAALVLADATRDDEDDLTLRVPSDGGARSVRALFAELDAHSIDVEEFSVRTPDLDDVFLALTNRTSRRESIMTNSTTRLGRNVNTPSATRSRCFTRSCSRSALCFRFK